MKKKLISAICLMLCLVGCSQTTQTNENEEAVTNDEQVQEVIFEDDNKKIKFRKMEGSNEVIATKEEAEEFVNIITEKIDLYM